jgi:hypothetical protein
MSRHPVGTLVGLGLFIATLILPACGGSPVQADRTPPPPPPPMDVAGIYHLVLSAAPECSLPDSAKHRQYTAAIQQDTSTLHLTLSGARLIMSGTDVASLDVPGTITSNNVVFRFQHDDYYGLYQMGEHLTATTYLTVAGSASGVATATTISAQLEGTLSVYQLGAGGSAQAIAVCTSSNHQLTFTR